MARKLIPATELLEMIRQRMLAPDGDRTDCSSCVPTQLSPIHAVAGGINWQVLDHPPCSAPCEARMLDVCSALANEYDVLWPQAGAPDPTLTGADAD